MCVDRQQGFTLIEILLVIVIATVLSAMVAPSFFQSTGASVESEARYVQKILRLASEEAQLSGILIRCSVYHDELRFETPAKDGQWQSLSDKQFQAAQLKAPIFIKNAHLNGDVAIEKLGTSGDEKPALARFNFWPDGAVSAGELSLAIKPAGTVLMIELRSGPGGIHVVEPVYE